MVITQGELKIEVPINAGASSSDEEEMTPEQVRIVVFLMKLIRTFRFLHLSCCHPNNFRLRQCLFPSTTLLAMGFSAFKQRR